MGRTQGSREYKVESERDEGAERRTKLESPDERAKIGIGENFNRVLNPLNTAPYWHINQGRRVSIPMILFHLPSSSSSS
ncbi:hypothetical protein E2C01_061825 [Portunus trituberculatus]|uniref:Uncharacterized protein n=1 Tax=Portunus trituberculatus TaxID=210409 RepID=A0A5B7HFH5_PORTR|nr:hypothetical protein [Portunus trituberculatus]